MIMAVEKGYGSFSQECSNVGYCRISTVGSVREVVWKVSVESLHLRSYRSACERKPKVDGFPARSRPFVISRKTKASLVFQSAGYTGESIAICMSVLSGADIIGRLTLPSITDIFKLRTKSVLFLGVGLSALARSGKNIPFRFIDIFVIIFKKIKKTAPGTIPHLFHWLNHVERSCSPLGKNGCLKLNNRCR